MVSQRRRSRAVAGVSAVLVLGVLLAAQVAQVTGPGPGDSKGDAGGLSINDAWDSFSVDVRMRRARVNKQGNPVGPPMPEVGYRWMRKQKGSGWQTTVVLNRPRPTVQSLKGPAEATVGGDLAPARLEDDEDGTPIRVYNAKGDLLALPSREDLKRRGVPDFADNPDLKAALAAGTPNRPRTVGRDWAEAFVMPDAKKGNRRKGLEKKFGPARGQVGRLDQFVAETGDTAEEVLLDRDYNVPVEMNIKKGGALVSHVTFSYDRHGGNALVRRSMHVESVLPDEDVVDDVETGVEEGARKGASAKNERPRRKEPRRLVTEIEFSNVKLEKKGGAR